jgi:hypothetical protein
MERENERIRRKYRAKEMERIMTLAERAEKYDIRIINKKKADSASELFLY